MEAETFTTDHGASTMDSDLDISRATPELWSALAEAQGEIENATKNQTNKHLGSNYADLAAILSEIRGPFSKHGLALTQHPTRDEDGRVVVTTITSHKSGGLLLSRLRLRPAKEFAHDIGAIITYLRKYAAAATAGIAQDDDDAVSIMPADEGYGADAASRQNNGRHGSDKGPKLPQRRQYQQQSPAQRARSGPERGGRIVDMRDQDGGQAAPQREQHQARNDAEGDAASGEALPWMGDDLSGGQRTLLLAKAKIAGMSDADMADRFGQVTSANVNETFAALRNIAEERQG